MPDRERPPGPQDRIWPGRPPRGPLSSLAAEFAPRVSRPDPGPEAPAPGDRSQRIREKASRLGIETAHMFGQQDAAASDAPVTEVEYIPYGSWPARVHRNIEQLEFINHLLEITDGGPAADSLYQSFTELMRTIRHGLILEISQDAVGIHLPEITDPEDVPAG
jgi:hypothetical protein